MDNANSSTSGKSWARGGVNSVCPCSLAARFRLIALSLTHASASDNGRLLELQCFTSHLKEKTIDFIARRDCMARGWDGHVPLAFLSGLEDFCSILYAATRSSKYEKHMGDVYVAVV